MNPLFTLVPRPSPWKVPAPIHKDGHEYYRLHRVSEIRFANGVVTAQVRGNKKPFYDTELSSRANGALLCSCSCRYFSDNGVCKHIVATWYEWADVRSQYLDHADGYAEKSVQKHAPKPQNQTHSEKNSNISPIAMTQINHLIKRSGHFEDAANIMFDHHPSILMDALQLMEQVRVKSVDFYNFCAYAGNEEITLSFMSSNPSGKCSKCPTSNSVYKCPHHLAAEFFLYALHHKEKTISEHCEELTKMVYSRTYRLFKKEFDSVFEIRSDNNEVVFTIERRDEKIVLLIQKSRRLKNGTMGVWGDYKAPLNSPPECFGPDICRIFKKCGSIQQSPGTPRLYAPNHIVLSAACNDHDASIIEDLRSYARKMPHHIANAVFMREPLTVCIEMKQDKNAVSYTMYLQNKEEKISLGPLIVFGGMEYLYAVEQKEETFCFYRLDSHTLSAAQLNELKQWCDAPFHREFYQEFIETLIHKLPDDINITLPEGGEIKDLTDLSPVGCLYLKEVADGFAVTLKYRYDTETISYKSHRDILRKAENSIERIRRNRTEERILFDRLLAHNMHKIGEDFYPALDPVVWLLEDAKTLAEEGFEIYGELFKYRLNKNRPRVNIAIKSGIDWFDVNGTVTIGDETVDFKKFLEALAQNERYIRIDNGAIVALPDEWRDKLSGVAGMLEETDESFSASRAQIGIIESLADIAEEFSCDKTYADYRKKFSEFEKIHEIEPPDYFMGTLRDYQKAGFWWLNFLKEFGMGGCLADEMGLGKTVQVLSQILHCRNTEGQKPSLIIVPTSLIFNWCQEIQKFTPTLTFTVHHGTNRAVEIPTEYDIILTSYGIVRRDIEMLEKIRFRYAVADESQSIKNPLSESAKAIRRLQADNRLCMTGTPVENTSVDLWSQFSFCSPGLLGTLEYFKATYAKRIETADDIKMAESLRRITGPFILARKKSVVASELPDKQITALHCEMTPEQRVFYDAWKEKIRTELAEKVSQKGFSKSRIEILQGLLRLRQICNHPSLVSPDYTGSSGKLEILFKHFETVIEEGHKILIFSTFLGMLDLIRKRFDRQNIRYSYLDGSTKDRQLAVNTFKENHAVKAFLISIKAGGFGLNLEEADYVYIVDPWWNPAVEMQAIDRAHRIGQTRSVFVYKSVCTNSIEEKILELQDKKLAIAGNIINFEKDIFKTLSAENLQQLFD